MEQELSKRFGAARRGVATAAVAVMVSACSSLPNPTAWVEDGRSDSAEQGEFSSLATVPERPEETGATAKQRRQQAGERSDRAKSLVSDRDLARHTRESLGGDEPPPSVIDEPDESSDASDVTTTAPKLASSNRPYVRDGETMSRDGRLRQTIARSPSEVANVPSENNSEDNSADNQDRSPNNIMMSSAPVLAAKVTALDEGRLLDAIYHSKLKESALSQQAAVNPETAEFATSSAPPLPARALKLATMLSALTDPNETVGANWPEGRLVRTSTGYQPGSPIIAASGQQDRSHDVLLARANGRGVKWAQDARAQIADGNRPNGQPAHVIAEARPAMEDDTGLGPVSALESPHMVKQQPDAIIRVANGSSDLAEQDMAKLRDIAVAQHMTGAIVRLIVHTAKDDNPVFRDEVPRDAQLTRALLIRMIEMGIPTKDLRLEAGVDYEGFAASDLADAAALEDWFAIYLDSPAEIADLPRPVS